MKSLSIIAFGLGLLSLVTAAPVSEQPQAQDRSQDQALEKRRGAQSCKIVNVDSYVNCRYAPTLDAGAIFGFPGGLELTFACYKKGDCYNGYCTWDRVTYLGTTCYVNGYFTDDKCSSKILPEC